MTLVELRGGAQGNRVPRQSISCMERLNEELPLIARASNPPKLLLGTPQSELFVTPHSPQNGGPYLGLASGTARKTLNTPLPRRQ